MYLAAFTLCCVDMSEPVLEGLLDEIDYRLLRGAAVELVTFLCMSLQDRRLTRPLLAVPVPYAIAGIYVMVG